MKIYLASDHAGFALKEVIKSRLMEKGEQVIDCGAPELHDGDSYVPYVAEAARNVEADAHHDPAYAIIFGGSGTGEAIVANRFPHVRAVVYNGQSLDIVHLGKEHNDANVLSIGARFVGESEAWEAVEAFLTTPFSHDERHVERILQIEEATQMEHN